MLLTSILALGSASLVASLPLEAAAVPQGLRVVGASVLGSGCPYGTADVRADASNTAMYIPKVDHLVSRADLFFLHRFSTINANMKGYAFLPAGTEGQCDNTFSFTGASGEVNYGIDLKGAREGAFSLSANPNVVSWSPCGGSTAILNMNTQCFISPTDDRALIAVGGKQFRRHERQPNADKMDRSTASAASSPSVLPLIGGGVRFPVVKSLDRVAMEHGHEAPTAHLYSGHTRICRGKGLAGQGWPTRVTGPWKSSKSQNGGSSPERLSSDSTRIQHDDTRIEIPAPGFLLGEHNPSPSSTLPALVAQREDSP
ncbi:predicted protein [Chaetomium globosum CBS 148.51]|uniref:GON domain-containing protein n=1 Tax=Chaetomium globosum (strain ATCC 6205 / CBS 148.51 / DSM 1962 / NBRC 6347 / NRRL 1970) TaxID=306901 RepID=Q2GRC2_CHAGB|nr:uncharacterized protein CHGG_09482 [Chaetomium globosum CBS 148.51]EAQ85468.1 predicted protein [Chaetomium globosum CBS 148.51]